MCVQYSICLHMQLVVQHVLKQFVFVVEEVNMEDCHKKTYVTSVTEQRNPITTNIDVATPSGMACT